ncbi:MAG: alkaline shock response membrane anchor protein AmaP [Candidatus Omnitrophica bacterium]|nr:alkaline shock response membrane anchor protein AmaP [Candidatus Omnitrophota bacterium]
MKLFTWIILSCYIVLFILIGFVLIAFSLHWIPIEGTVLWLQIAYLERDARVVFGLIGLGLILLNWVYADLALARVRRQKTIAFENPEGRVTVSLAAIEDFIRRSTEELPEVKELRSDVIARKGRILVRARAVFWSDAHIPDAAEKIQAMVRGKVQEMLTGIEEPVHVQVHVAKIIHRDQKTSLPDRKSVQYTPPFRGY